MISCAIAIARGVHLCSKGLFRHLRARGNRVVIWCANTREDLWELHRTFGDELDGIMTDNPLVLKKFVEEHSLV